MRLYHRADGSDPNRADRRAALRRARSLFLPLIAPVALMLSACAGDEPPEDPNTEAAEALHDAQLLNFHDATLMPEGSENGTYSELATVQYSEEVRDTTEVDKPECLDAANRWGDLDSVQEAPASVAAYEWEEAAVSHMLVELEEADASEALATEPPDTCDEYTATYEDGSSSEYGVRDLELPDVGDESRAFAIEVHTDGDDSNMFSVMYRNGGLLGTTSVLGQGEAEDYEDILLEFSEASVERQGQMLG